MADYTVSGAGSTVINGDYTENGTYDGQPAYESGTGYWLFWNGVGLWVLSNSKGNPAYYTASTILGTWSVFMGDAPAPSVVAYGGGSSPPAGKRVAMMT